MNLRSVAMVVAGLLSCLPLLAQGSPTDVAFERAGHLRRGINTSMWFAQSPRDYSPQRLTTYTTADDFRLIHQLGFDHVRLSIDPQPLLRDPLTNGLNADHLKLLDDALKEALDAGLNVVLDIHPEDDFKLALRTDRQAQAEFVHFWSAFAAHYAETDPERVYFEVLNEPEVPDAGSWANIQGQVVPAIRAAARRHTIIATAAHYSGLRDLLTLQPVSDRNLIYTFHDYEPFPFTHQGAGWTMDEVKPLRQIPYPSSPENIAPKLALEPDLAGQYFLHTYGFDRWDAARVESEISFARKWGEQYHVPVWCGEFGVYREHADPQMRAQWLHDMRVAFEANGIGWDMWDYRASFGLVSDVNGKRVADPLVVKALGLKQ